MSFTDIKAMLDSAPVCLLCDQKILAKRAGNACGCQTHRDCGIEGTHPIECVICEKPRERMIPTFWTRIPTDDGERWAAVIPPGLHDMIGRFNFWIGPYPMDGLIDLSHKLVTHKGQKMIVLFDEERLPAEIALFMLKPSPGYSMEYFATGQVTLRLADQTQSDMTGKLPTVVGPVELPEPTFGPVAPTAS